MPKTLRFYRTEDDTCYSQRQWDNFRAQVRAQVEDAPDEACDAYITERVGPGKWERIVLLSPFTAKMRQAVESAIMEWDAARQDYFRNGNRYHGALCSVAVEEWSLGLEASEPIYQSLPDLVAQFVGALVFEACYPLSKEPDFTTPFAPRPNG